MTEIKYQRFESRWAELPISFLYPDGWEGRDVMESTHAEIFMTPPRPERGVFSVALSLRVWLEGPQDLSDVVMEHLNSFSRLSSYQKLAQVRGMLGERPAEEVEMTYRVPQSLDTVQVSEITVRDRRIFVGGDGRVYELIYSAPKAEYETWLKAFEILVRTFTFDRAPAPHGFDPLIATRSTTHLVPEERNDYESRGSDE